MLKRILPLLPVHLYSDVLCDVLSLSDVTHSFLFSPGKRFKEAELRHTHLLGVDQPGHSEST